MMTQILQDQLTRVQNAIAAIEEGGQSIGYEGRTVTKGDLKTLYAREALLLKRISRQRRGAVRNGIPL